MVANIASRHAESASTARTNTSVVTESDLAHLPAAVRRYMTYTGVLDKPWIKTACIEYQGRFRLGADKPWMSIRVHQVYTTNPPGFVWKAQFSMAGLPFMVATDTYKNGHGHMLGKLLGLVKVVDGQSPEIDQGTMVRYLQEMMWFPVAYLGANITWHAVDEHAADVTLTDSGKNVSGRMYFDDAGRLLTFSAQRYGDFNGKVEMRTWTTPTTDYAHLAGLKLPAGGMGVWQLPDGDLSYVDVRVTRIEYNQSIDKI